MIYLVVAVIILHTISLPIAVCGAVEINSDENSGQVVFGLFYLPVIKKNIDMRRVENALRGKTDGVQEDEVQEKSKKPHKFLIRFGKSILTVLRVRVFDLSGHVGLGDAAASAVTVSAMRVAFCNACKVLGFRHGVCELSPDFDAEIITARFVGIISVCIADIIYAAVRAIVCGRGRRGRKYAKPATE